jgi:hypothetical protein
MIDDRHFTARPFGRQAPRHEQVILHLLTHYVRVVGAHQLCGLTQQKSVRLLRRLEAKGLVTLRVAVVPPELKLAAPVFAWQPGTPPPLFDRLAWRLSARWQGRPRRVLVASASAAARHAAGSLFGGRPVRRTEFNHDLHVTALYFKFVREEHERARLWIHEDAMTTMRPAGELIPDVMLGETAVEFGGKYQAAKLRAIHRGHALAGRPYELW